MRRRTIGWLVCLLLSLAGCATTGPAPEVTAQPLPEGHYWWQVRYRMDWPADAEPRWWVDLALAQGVVAPVLRQHLPELPLWRFHRRAARDAAGHQFSLLFYAPPERAEALIQALRASPMLAELQARGWVTEVSYGDPAQPSRPALEDTSDPNWPPLVARSWPYFIMGVSRMWLEQVDTLVAEAPAGDLEARYSAAAARLDELWEREGQHAYLHHLNAVFGYRPLRLLEQRSVRF